MTTRKTTTTTRNAKSNAIVERVSLQTLMRNNDISYASKSQKRIRAKLRDANVAKYENNYAFTRDECARILNIIDATRFPIVAKRATRKTTTTKSTRVARVNATNDATNATTTTRDEIDA